MSAANEFHTATFLEMQLVIAVSTSYRIDSQ